MDNKSKDNKFKDNKSNLNIDSIVQARTGSTRLPNKVMKYSIELLKKEKCDTVCSVYSQHHNPYFNMMEKGKNGFLKFSKKLSHKVKNRQNAPIVYQLNGLFVIDVKKFLKYKTIIMPKILPYEIPTEMGLMIDTEFEFQIADMIAKKKIKLETI